jgi:hypothetical protein
MRQYGLIHPHMLRELEPQFYASVCSLFAPGMVIGPVGEEIPTLTPLPALANLPCRIAPKSNRDNRTPQQEYTEGVMDVTIAGYYPFILHDMIPVIDGYMYAMEGEPEWDGNQKTTRFDVRVVGR